MQVFPRTTIVHIAVTNNTVARMDIQPAPLRYTPRVRIFSMVMIKLSNLISLSCDSPSTVTRCERVGVAFGPVDLRLNPL
eukprot:scaffold3141_cov53-Attheya_sp.AAC.9